MKLNASQNNSISIIRNKIKIFCKSSIQSKKLKVVVIDEADSLSVISQEALRRIIEKFSLSSRFILICNYPTRIIEPLQSRFILFKVVNLNFENIIKLMKFYILKKNMCYKLDFIENAIHTTNGDKRKLKNCLKLDLNRIFMHFNSNRTFIINDFNHRYLLELHDKNIDKEIIDDYLLNFFIKRELLKNISENIFEYEIDLDYKIKFLRYISNKRFNI